MIIFADFIFALKYWQNTFFLIKPHLHHPHEADLILELIQILT